MKPFRWWLTLTLTATLLLWSRHVQNPDRARAFMETLGYTSIRWEGRYRDICGRDSREYPFHAVSPTGQPVQGWVCAGLFGYGITELPDRGLD